MAYKPNSRIIHIEMEPFVQTRTRDDGTEYDQIISIEGITQPIDIKRLYVFSEHLMPGSADHKIVGDVRTFKVEKGRFKVVVAVLDKDYDFDNLGCSCEILPMEVDPAATSVVVDWNLSCLIARRLDEA
jgi:hypothetical protein